MKHFLLATTLFASLSSFAQKEDKILFKEATVETDDYKVYIVDGVSTDAYTKFKIKVFNKTNDYLLVKASEILFEAGGKSLTNKENNLVIGPNDEDYRVVDYKGTGKQETFSLDFKGVYKASAGGKVLNASDFDLPATKNDLEAGGFSCTMKKHDANTDRAVAKFECEYKGDGVGIINPYKCAAIMPNGTENANAKKNKAKVLEKGQKDEFVVQFEEREGAGDLQKKSIKVKWNDTFRESKLMPLAGAKIDMQKDQEKMDSKKKKK